MQRYIYSLVVCVSMLCVYLLLNSNYFFVEQLEWTGFTYLKEQDLSNYLEFEQKNVWRVNFQSLRNKLLDHPWIKGVTINWNWPNRLTINIDERIPIAMLPMNGDWFLLDNQGKLMSSPVGMHNYVLPVITNINPEDEDKLRTITRMLEQAPKSILEQLSEWNQQEQVFITRDGIQIKLGNLTDLDRKYELLQVILDDINSQNVEVFYIDLRIPKNPVVKAK